LICDAIEVPDGPIGGLCCIFLICFWIDIFQKKLTKTY